MKCEFKGMSGRWACTVEAASVPHDNFPYVLTLAIRKPQGITRAPTTPPVPPAPRRQAVEAPTAVKLWPCYVLLDCSRSASDIGPAVGQGLSAFIRGMSRIQCSRVAPALSLVECRTGPVSVPQPQRMTELGPVNLACRGDTSIRTALAALLSGMAVPDARYSGKPFIIIVLAKDPSDDVASEAQQLKQLALTGRANVTAIGLGLLVSETTLSALSTIPLRVTDPTIHHCVACCEWMVAVADSILRSLSQASGKPVVLPPLPQGVQSLR
jgi:uncharacterized protein YegL